MVENIESAVAASPFHTGEQAMQERIGVRELMQRRGSRTIHSSMPDQHRSFYEQLPLLVVGSVDSAGSPWASLLTGTPGFIQSPDEHTLRVQALVADGDPGALALQTPGAALGVLGIDMSTRRRNRMNGRIAANTGDGFSIRVEQAFGNCPKYIQKRSIAFPEHVARAEHSAAPQSLSELDGATQDWISRADTFFVASAITAQHAAGHEGVDVSHRGGHPGFVKVSGNTLTIPDYAGNKYFNTLGNFLLNPKAGLTFVDFDRGDVLMLTGEVELLCDEDPAVKSLEGAERAWQFTMNSGLWLRDALGFELTLQELSPHNPRGDH